MITIIVMAVLDATSVVDVLWWMYVLALAVHIDRVNV